MCKSKLFLVVVTEAIVVADSSNFYNSSTVNSRNTTSTVSSMNGADSFTISCSEVSNRSRCNHVRSSSSCSCCATVVSILAAVNAAAMTVAASAAAAVIMVEICQVLPV
jgi:hypothetical protein